MKTVRLLVVSATVTALTLSVIGATGMRKLASSTAADSASVAKIVTEFHTALSNGDNAKSVSLLATDVVILESGGIESRAEYIAHHLPEDIEFAKAVSTSQGIIRVTVDGTTAWTSATSSTEGQFKGRAINSVGAESMVLTKRDGRWRIRSIHWSSRRRT